MTLAASSSKLRTLLVSDGKPGHYHLADGICAALGRRRELELTRVNIERPKWLPARALSAMTNGGGMARQLVPRTLGFAPSPVPACDLVVSAGGDTLAANIALARSYGCPNIFYGSLRRYRSSDFALVLSSYAPKSGQTSHVMTLKPSSFDPDTMPKRTPSTGLPPVTGMLVGGDSGTVRFERDDWGRLMGLLQDAVATQSRWIVSNSRRTPNSISDELAALAERAGGLIQFIDVRKAGAGTLAALLAQSDRIAVTVDSSSMISEAIWARKPVVALVPREATLPALEQTYRDFLADKGWIADLPLTQASEAMLNARSAAVRAMTSNPLDDLADLLAKRLPTLFN